jgi:threonine dehydrogenase-like Zn-dependent dehydrogenase
LKQQELINRLRDELTHIVAQTEGNAPRCRRIQGPNGRRGSAGEFSHALDRFLAPFPDHIRGAKVFRQRNPVRAYITELLPDILEGKIHPGRVFDRVVDLNQVPDGYRAMNERKSIRVMVTP